MIMSPSFPHASTIFRLTFDGALLVWEHILKHLLVAPIPQSGNITMPELKFEEEFAPVRQDVFQNIGRPPAPPTTHPPPVPPAHHHNIPTHPHTPTTPNHNHHTRICTYTPPPSRPPRAAEVVKRFVLTTSADLRALARRTVVQKRLGRRERTIGMTIGGSGV